MKVDEDKLPDKPASTAGDPEEGDPNALSSRELFRLLIAPTVATLLFIGGVYWLQLQVRTGTPAQEASAIVQVHLLPRPEPVPVPVAPATRSAMASVPSRTDSIVDAHGAASKDDAPDRPAQAPSAAPAAAPSISPSAVVDAPQNSAIAAFRERLLRHIARYQRYPKAAERMRVQGTVGTVFSISRDGQLLGVWVKTSSGEAVLDAAALDTIRRAQPLPPIPAMLPEPLRIEVALGFDPS